MGELRPLFNLAVWYASVLEGYFEVSPLLTGFWARTFSGTTLVPVLVRELAQVMRRDRNYGCRGIQFLPA